VALDVLRPTGRSRTASKCGARSVLRAEHRRRSAGADGPGRYEGHFPAKDVARRSRPSSTATRRTGGRRGAGDGRRLRVLLGRALAQRSNERFFATLESARGRRTIDLEKLDDALALDQKAPNIGALPWQVRRGASTRRRALPWIAAPPRWLLSSTVAVRRVRIPWDRVLPEAQSPSGSGRTTVDLSALYLDILKDRLYTLSGLFLQRRAPRRPCTKSWIPGPAYGHQFSRSHAERSGRHIPGREGTGAERALTLFRRWRPRPRRQTEEKVRPSSQGAGRSFQNFWRPARQGK